jgi:hypothetical protein
MPATIAQDTEAVSNGPLDGLGGGLLKLKVHKQNPLDRSEPPRVTIARDEVTQKMASSWHIWHPIEGIQHPQALYLSPDWEVSFMPLHVG